MNKQVLHVALCVCIKHMISLGKEIFGFGINVGHKVCMCGCGFGGLEVACWPLVPKFASSNPTEAVGFFRAKKNPQHAFLRKGSKAVCLMS